MDHTITTLHPPRPVGMADDAPQVTCAESIAALVELLDEFPQGALIPAAPLAVLLAALAG